MADTPPQGSLLSNFLSGNPLGRPNLGGTPRKKPAPPSVKSFDQNAALGLTFGAASIGAAETLLGGVKEGLIGTGTLRRFGGEDKVSAAAYDYTKTALDKIGAKDLLPDLGITSEADFTSRYVAAMPTIQAEENKQRIAQGKPAIQGFGDYQIRPLAGPVPNPLTIVQDLATQRLDGDARQVFDGVVNLAGDHSELAFFTKEELTRHLPIFLQRQIKVRSAELTAQLATGGLVTALLDAHDRLEKIQREDEADRNRQNEDKNGTLSKFKQELRQRVFDKQILGRSVTKLYQLQGEIGRALGNPLGYAWDRLVVNTIRRTIFGEQKIFGRLGLGWGKKLGNWLANQGRWGKLLKWGSANLRQGLGGLVRKGIFNSGKLIGRALSAIGRAAIGAIVQVLGAIASALAGAIVGAAGAIFAAIGLIGLIIIVGTIFVLIVLIPFAHQSTAQAAPPDLTVAASASPSSNVTSDQIIILNIQVTANKPAQNLSVKATFDSHFAPGSISGRADGVVNSSVVTLPATPLPNLASGQSISWQISAKTISTMSTTTLATVTISATTSNNLSGGATIGLNGSGIAQFDPNLPYGWPINGQISQGFHTNDLLSCDNSDIISCGTAVDIAGDHQRVCATMDGIVKAISDGFGFNPANGPWVYNPTSGFWTVYAHMESIVLVRVGDQIHRGQLLGYSDSSGFFGSGPHLHYAIYKSKNSTGGRGIGPGQDFVNYVPGDPIVPGTQITDGGGC